MAYPTGRREQLTTVLAERRSHMAADTIALEDGLPILPGQHLVMFPLRGRVRSGGFQDVHFHLQDFVSVIGKDRHGLADRSFLSLYVHRHINCAGCPGLEGPW